MISFRQWFYPWACFIFRIPYSQVCYKTGISIPFVNVILIFPSCLIRISFIVSQKSLLSNDVTGYSSVSRNCAICSVLSLIPSVCNNWKRSFVNWKQIYHFFGVSALPFLYTACPELHRMSPESRPIILPAGISPTPTACYHSGYLVGIQISPSYIRYWLIPSYRFYFLHPDEVQWYPRKCRVVFHTSGSAYRPIGSLLLVSYPRILPIRCQETAASPQTTSIQFPSRTVPVHTRTSAISALPVRSCRTAPVYPRYPLY